MFVGWVFSELSVFEHGASGSIKDWECQWWLWWGWNVVVGAVVGVGHVFGKERKAVVGCL